jgi:hypothetical protein
MLVEVAGDPVAGQVSVRCGRDRFERANRAVELGAGPGQGAVTSARDVGGDQRPGQVADRGVRHEHGGQRAGVTKPGRIHRRRDDRLAVGVAAGSVVPAQQRRTPGQVLGDPAVRPGRPNEAQRHPTVGHGM